MKSIIFLFFLSFSISLFAQQSSISGAVTVFNSAFETGTRQYITNAQVEDDFKKSNATTTGGNGRFKLVFVGIKDHEKVSFNVKKETMEIVNTEALYAVAGQKEQVAVFMSPEGKVAENKLKYYQINREASEKALTTKLKTIGAEILKLKQNETANTGQIAKLQTEYNSLQQQFEKIDQSAREMADRYAKINLDDQTKEYQAAFRFFQKGQLGEALKILHQVDLEKTGSAIVQEQERNRKIDKEWFERDSIKNEKKRQVTEGLSFKAQLHKTQFEFEKVEETYQLLLKLDSTNVYTLGDFAAFLAKQNKKYKAITYYEKALALAKTPELKAVFLNGLGTQYFDNQKMLQAEAVYNEALKIRRQLADKNPSAFLPDLANTLNNLGIYYYSNQKMSQAEAVYNEALKIQIQLADKNPVAFITDVVNTLNNLGVFYSTNQKMSQAETIYNDALKIHRRLAQIDPNAFLPGVAATLNNLGNYYLAYQKMPEAEAAFIEALKIKKQLADKNPGAFLPDLANTFNNLGAFYYSNQKMSQAEAAYIEALNIRRQLAEINPDAFLPVVATTLNNLGIYYRANQKMPQAEFAYNEALNIRRQLANKNPDAFLPDLANTLNNLGNHYSVNQKMPQAEACYNEALKTYRQLADKNPNTFLADLATTLNNLGEYYHTNQKMPQFEATLNEALNIRRQLASKNPEAFLPDVAMTLNNLGVFYYSNRNMPQAEAALNEALNIYRPLADKKPEAFLPNVAMTLTNLGVFYQVLKNYKHALVYFGKAMMIQEEVILRGDVHQSKNWITMLRDVSTLRDSAAAKKEYVVVAQAEQRLAEGYDKLRGANEKLLAITIQQWGSLSWWALFAKDYTLSEKAALRCLELDNTQEWILTNLGHSQLLKGQYKQAFTTYEKLQGKKNSAGKNYKQVLLDNLKALEAEGITHKDFAQARAAIEKW